MSEHENIIKKLPFTSDGVPIVPGDMIWFKNTDHAYFGEDEAIEAKVQSISLGIDFNEYKGTHTIVAGDWEGGNLDCYSDENNAC